MDMEELKSIALKDMAEYKLVLKEKLAVRTFELAEKIIAKSKSKDKRDLLTVSTYDLFLLGVNIINDDKFSYEDTLKYANYSKDSINAWGYEKTYNILAELSRNMTSDGYIKTERALELFKKLNINSAFISYSMSPVYVLVSLFLRFKSQVREFESKYSNLSYAAKLKYINNLYSSSGISNMFGFITNYMEEERDRHRQRQEIAKEKLKYTKEVMKFIENGEIQYLRNMDPEWHHYLGRELLEALYEIINTNQLKEYGDIEKERKELEQEKNKSRVVSFLYSNLINPNDISSSIIDRLEELDKSKNVCNLIDFLKYIGLSCYVVINSHIDLLENIEEERIDYVKFLIDSKVLSKELIRNNLDILSDKFMNMKANYEVLKGLIDFNNMFYDDSILLISLKDLKRRLDVLSNYDLNKNNFIFLLMHYEYLSIYDLLIEKNISTLLFVQICRTQNPINTIKRILVYEMIGEEYQTVSHELRKEVAVDNKSLIRNEDLDMYVSNIVPSLLFNSLDEQFIGRKVDTDFLDNEFWYDKDRYLIGNVVISRPKFIRNYSNGHDVMSSLISNSIISEEDYYEMFGDVKKIKK